MGWWVDVWMGASVHAYVGRCMPVSLLVWMCAHACICVKLFLCLCTILHPSQVLLHEQLLRLQPGHSALHVALRRLLAHRHSHKRSAVWLRNQRAVGCACTLKRCKRGRQRGSQEVKSMHRSTASDTMPYPAPAPAPAPFLPCPVACHVLNVMNWIGAAHVTRQ